MQRLKMLVIFLLVTLLAQFSCGQDKSNQITNPDTTIPEPAGWKLVWNDEFNNTALDLTKWEFEVNADGGGNDELQYYTNRNVNAYLEDGCLIIQALKERYTGSGGARDYTSARLRTYKKGDWKYGRFEIKAKLPYGQGLWPAIWMMPTESKYGGWPSSGEIDIVELLGQEPSKIYGTLHYGGPYPQHDSQGKQYVLPQGNFANSFHVFTLEWYASSMRWYVDGIFYLSLTTWHAPNAPFPAPFDQFFYLILNVAVGGRWPGNPDYTTLFPQKMYVDYVRVYRQAD